MRRNTEGEIVQLRIGGNSYHCPSCGRRELQIVGYLLYECCYCGGEYEGRDATGPIVEVPIHARV